MALRVDTLRAIRRRISMQEAAGSTKLQKSKNTADIASTVFFGTNGDTELFKKSRNINSFRACRIANNLY